MKKILLVLLILIFTFAGCSSYSYSDKQLKDTIDKVLTYKNGYDDEMKKYINEDNFYNCNYPTFYSFFLDEVEITKYESEIKKIERKKGNYTVYMIVNIAAQGHIVKDEEGEHRGSAVGKDVPLKIVLEEKDEGLYLNSFKEYEELSEAIEENPQFK